MTRRTSAQAIAPPGAVEPSRIASPATWPVWRRLSSARNWASRLVSWRTGATLSGRARPRLGQRLQAAAAAGLAAPLHLLAVPELVVVPARAGDVVDVAALAAVDVAAAE